MKQKRFNNPGLLAALLFLLFAATACLDEKYETRDSADGEKSLTFSLSLPGTVAGRSTYALTPTDEEEVANVQVLLFSGGNYLDTRYVPNANITSVGNKKQFTVQIPEGSYSSIVVLSNSADIVSGAGLLSTDSKGAALAKLTLTNSATWVADKTDPTYRPIPMWGELGSMVVTQATSTASQSSPLQLSLTRMLAKVSVKLSGAASSNFQLKTIYTPNSYNRGYVAPLAANWSSGVATAASVPAGATKQFYNLSYSGTQITTPDVASEGEIYLFESNNSNQTGSDGRTCLILGGLYVPENKFCHYRLDFVSNNGGTDRYIDLLRNHHYAFNVTKIDGPGYQTPNEAFASKPINIEASLAYNDDAAIAHVASNERYMLGLSQKNYIFDKEAQTAAGSENKLTILTDYSGGWYISPTDIIDLATNTPATWLRVAAGDQSGVANSSKTISLLLDQTTAAISRSATILVKAGVLTMVVQVNQNYGLQATVDPEYHLCSVAASFVLKSSASWRIKSVTEQVTNGTGPLLNLSAADKLKVGTTGAPNLTGENVTFTTKNLPYPSSGMVTVVFESNDNPKKFKDVTVTLNMISEYYPASHKGWAGSNIYWDGSKLTFDDVNVQTRKNYQGVYFQWGSLTGVSPLGGYGSTTMLYPPGESATPAGTTLWTALPRVSENLTITSYPLAPKTENDRGYLYELDTTTGTGDICKYITEQGGGTLHGKKWRMPTSNEFEAVGSYSKSGLFAGQTSTQASGSYAITSGYTKTSIGSPFFPASGYREVGNASLTGVGALGYYWSASPYGKNGGIVGFADYVVLASGNARHRAWGFSVRCVVE